MQRYTLILMSDESAPVRRFHVEHPDVPVFIGQVGTADPDAFNNLWGDTAVYTAPARR